MGILSWARRRRETFDTPPKPIDQMFAELLGRTSTGGPISRVDALSVPAVVQGRNAICAVATLPLRQLGPDNAVVDHPLLRQIDMDVANVVTLAATIEDLIFDAVSWWEVTSADFDGFPVSARHLDVGSVTLQPPVTTRSPTPLPSGLDPHKAVVWVDGNPVGADRIIRFDSPLPPLRKVGAPAIRRAILLDKAASMYADDPRPLDYFTPGEGADPVDDDDVKDILAEWKAARKARSTAYVPASLQYHTVDAPTPQQLQLVELQRQVNVEIANLFGLDSEDLGVSTTSRTYANSTDRRQDRINDVLSPFMRAITDRLSMGDVTRRGYRAVFDLDDFMRADPTTRWSNYRQAKDMGVMTVDEIREAEYMPPLPAGAEPEPAPAPAQEDPMMEPAMADRPAEHTFDGAETFTLDVPVAEFSVDSENRIIEGLAVPYGAVGSKGGMRFRFDRGSIQWNSEHPGRVKLMFPRHTEAVGTAIQLKNTAGGLFARFKVGRGAEGDRALAAAEDGVFDGLSVGVDFDAAVDAAPDARDKGLMRVRRADLRHVALTDEPVFDDARVTRVAASRDTGGGPVPDTETTEPEAPETPTPAPSVGGTVFTSDQVAEILVAARSLTPFDRAATESAPAAPDRQVVDPTRPLSLSVNEPPSYVFDRSGTLRTGAFDFGMDFIRAVNPEYNDKAARDRVMEFVRAQFDVASTDVNELNPTINMPRYIDEREFMYPIYAAVSRGAPPNGIQPFQWPAFSSASGLVAAHAQGTEPSSGTYVTTSQSVTPTGLAGKAKITRETWDMGGTPGVSDIIWRRITRDWYETLEAAIVTMLDAASPTSLGTFTAGGGVTGQTLAAEMVQNLTLLQFARGGFRFDTAFAEAGLYTHLAKALDDAGRPLFPVLGAQNAPGDVSARWSGINVGGVPFLPAWALGATVGSAADSSYLIDRTAVDAWATPPQRLTFDLTEVGHVYIGVWGYHAEAINDLAGVREISYDPVA